MPALISRKKIRTIDLVQILRRYLYSVQRNGKFACDHCEKSYVDKPSVRRHIKTAHEEDKHDCDPCDKSYADRQSLLRHKKIVHGDKGQFSCQECDKTFFSKDSLTKHVKSVHTEDKHDCDHCDKSYLDKQSLRRHVKTIHKKDLIENQVTEGSSPSFKYPFHCDQCNKSYADKYNLGRHVKSVHEGSLFTCDICQKSFSWKENLKRHMKLVHKKEEERPELLPEAEVGAKFSDERCICPVCKCIISVKSLTRHLYTQHNKVYVYSQSPGISSSVKNSLPQSTLSNSNLEDDVEIISDQFGTPVYKNFNNFRCETCDNFFGTEANLQFHNQKNHQISVLNSNKKNEISYSMSQHLTLNGFLL